MTVKEFYQSVGGDYEAAMRIINKEERIAKVLDMLPLDDNAQLLRQAMAQRDQKAAFAAAHTLKGVLLNLSLTRQAQAVSDLTQALRQQPVAQDAPALFEVFDQSYQELLCTLSACTGQWDLTEE